MALRLVARRDGEAHSLELTFGPQDAFVPVAGDIDLLAAPDLRRLLDSLHPLHLTIDADLADVTFVDSAGIAPLADAARQREHDRMPPLLITACSRPERRLLEVTRLRGDPALDVAAWEEMWLRFQQPDGAFWRTATPTAPDPVFPHAGSGASKPVLLAGHRPGRPHANGPTRLPQRKRSSRGVWIEAG